ncbi:YbjN domain-containing protein [Corynebacterium mendelii]|uniref:YbjN domain-containing protein n=2 Tax=Corynebacterium mendelii TaxID=2765362 RepID=A0A939IVT9_9CORY|nr:YbjN domain-containing protein [Corynebacterium mendelii]
MTTIPAVTLDRCHTVLDTLGIAAAHQGGDLLVWDDDTVSRSVTVNAAAGFVEVTAIVWVSIDTDDDIPGLLEIVNTINSESVVAGVELAAESSAVVTHVSTVAPDGLSHDQLRDFITTAIDEVNAAVERLQRDCAGRVLPRPVEESEAPATPQPGGAGTEGKISPLTADRVRQWLEQSGWAYSRHRDSDRFEAEVDGVVIGIDCVSAPRMISVQSPMRIEFAAAEKTAALLVANGLNGIPLTTAFATEPEDDDGGIGVIAYSPIVSVGGGYTDGQFALALSAACKACFTAHQVLAQQHIDGVEA